MGQVNVYQYLKKQQQERNVNEIAKAVGINNESALRCLKKLFMRGDLILIMRKEKTITGMRKIYYFKTKR